MSMLTRQGVALPVARRGQGTPFLLLHGGEGPHHRLPLFQRLAERFDVIAPVHPGFAGSVIPEHFDSLEDLVYLDLDLLDILNLRQVVLLGCSIGGWAEAEITVLSFAA
jgi:pimeloyl-ACP methyl ester carboxylesterase